MRLRAIIMKELRAVREDPSFHLAALVSPLLFLLAFSLMLSSGIVLPLATYPDAGESAFLQGVADYRAPDGTPYLSLSPAAADVPRSDAENDLLVVRQEPQLENGVLSGELIHYVNDVNENMTKNYRNRVDGADQICHGHSSRYCAGDPKHLRPQPDARRCFCDGCVRRRHSQCSGWLAHHAGLAGAGGGVGLCALS